jgi:hypothetical protein
MRFYYKNYYDRAIPGQREGSINGYRVRSYVNKLSGALEEWTLTLPATPAADTEFVVINNNHAKAKFKTDADPTKAELATGLLTAIRTNPAFGLYLTAVVNVDNDIVLTSNAMGTTNAITVTGTGLSAAITQASVTSPSVPFGRFVGRPAGSTDPNLAGLLTQVTDSVLGITSLIRDVERSDIRTGEPKAVYSHSEVMDVVDYCGGSMGIWCECIEPDITIADGCYVTVAAGQEGKVTKISAGNIDLTAKAKFVTPVSTTVEGVQVVLVHFDI